MVDTNKNLGQGSDELEKVEFISDDEENSTTDEIMALLGETDTDVDDMSTEELLKNATSVITGADKIKDDLMEAGIFDVEKDPFEGMVMDEIFDIEVITEEKYKSIYVKNKLKIAPLMSIFDAERGTLDVPTTIKQVYGGDYVTGIVERMKQDKKKKILEKQTATEDVDFDEIEKEEDQVAAARKLVGELDGILKQTTGNQGFLEKFAEKAGNVGAINFLMKKSGYLDSAARERIDTMQDALNMLDNLEESYRHRTKVIENKLRNNLKDYEKLKNQRKVVVQLEVVIKTITDIRTHFYNQVVDLYEEKLSQLPDHRKPEAITYQEEFHDEVLSLAKVEAAVVEYKETLENLEISTRTHVKILSSLYQTLLTGLPQTKSILTALLQQMDNAAVEHQVIEIEETFRDSLTSGMKVMRKSTQEAAQRADKISSGTIFAKGELKKEKVELKKIERQFDKAREKLLKARNEVAEAVEEYEEVEAQAEEIKEEVTNLNS